MNDTRDKDDRAAELRNLENSLERSVNLALLFDFYGDLLSEKQRKTVELWCDEDLSLSEIASICSITRAGVHDRIAKSERILRSYEEKLGLAARFQRIKGEINRIAELAATLEDRETAEKITETARKLLEEL